MSVEEIQKQIEELQKKLEAEREKEAEAEKEARFEEAKILTHHLIVTLEKLQELGYLPKVLEDAMKNEDGEVRVRLSIRLPRKAR